MPVFSNSFTVNGRHGNWVPFSVAVAESTRLVRWVCSDFHFHLKITFFETCLHEWNEMCVNCKDEDTRM